MIRELQGEISQHSPWLVEGADFKGEGLKEGTPRSSGMGDPEGGGMGRRATLGAQLQRGEDEFKDTRGGGTC